MRSGNYRTGSGAQIWRLLGTLVQSLVEAYSTMLITTTGRYVRVDNRKALFYCFLSQWNNNNNDKCKKKLSSLQRLSGRHPQTPRSTTANITLQHMVKMSLCCEVISSFVIFAVLHMSSLKGVVNCYFFTFILAVFLYDFASAYRMSSKWDCCPLS